MTRTWCRRMSGRVRTAWEHTPLPWETLGGIAAAMLTQHARPLRLPAWTRLTGWMVVCGGLALVISAVRERGPGSLEKPGTLVTTGLHGRSRNPMYVGFCVVQVGLAGATRNAWILASCPVSAGLLHQSILGEERLLRSTFGDEYDSYRASVPRYWRPPAGRLAIPQ